MALPDDIKNQAGGAMWSDKKTPSPIKQALDQCNAARETLQNLEIAYNTAYPSEGLFPKSIPRSEIETMTRIAEFQGTLGGFASLLQTAERDNNLELAKPVCGEIKANLAGMANILGREYLPGSKVEAIKNVAQSTQTILQQNSDAVGMIIENHMTPQKILVSRESGRSMN